MPRKPYKISVTPGWNLISLPAHAAGVWDRGVCWPNNPYISPVLGYQEGDWVTAIQEEDGTWRGRLTEIKGGYGYWVHARTFETIETMLTETDPASVLPTVAGDAGLEPARRAGRVPERRGRQRPASPTRERRRRLTTT